MEINPRFQSLPPPVILIGMHRSGTSLVAGLLIILGLYLHPDVPIPNEGDTLASPGAQQRQDGYGEAYAFRQLNERILQQAGAVWQYPEPFLKIRNTPAFAEAAIETLKSGTHSPHCIDYLDRMPAIAEGHWGWKDPRNSLTLPYWLRLFPDARVLHVRRDPEAVVTSLLRRVEATREIPSGVQRVVRTARGMARQLGLSSNPPAPAMFTREDWRRLAEIYVAECLRYRDLGERYLEVAFETLLRAPETEIARIARFAGLSPSESRRQRASAFVAPPNPPTPFPAREGGKSERGELRS